MRCTNCDTSAAPHELADGKCLKCLGFENTTLRLLLAHVVMAIENGKVISDPGGTVYQQLFGIKFLEHLKEVLGAVNTQNVPTPEFVYAPLNNRPTWWVNESGRKGSGHGASANNAAANVNEIPAAKPGDNLVIFTVVKGKP